MNAPVQIRKTDTVERLRRLASLEGKTITFTHTVVEPEFEGKGVGSALAKHVLDDSRAQGLKVVPACKFIAAYISRHSEYQDLVAG